MLNAKWTRRELLKTGLAASAGVATTRAAHAWAGIADSFAAKDCSVEKLSPSGSQELKLEASSPRERHLVDFGCRFHLGHASDPPGISAGARLGGIRRSPNRAACPK